MSLKRPLQKPLIISCFNVKPNEIYSETVAWIRAISISIATSGWSRPNSKPSYVRSGDNLPWTKENRPPGFEKLKNFSHDRVGFAQAAITLSFPLKTEKTCLPSFIDAAVKRVVELDKGASEWRRERIMRLRHYAAALAPLSEEILRSCPSLRVALKSRNPAMWCALIEGLNLPCSSFPAKMFRDGFSVIGVIEPCGLWRIKSDTELEIGRPSLNLKDFRESSPAYFERLQARLIRSHVASTSEENTKLQRLAWEASIKEVTVKGSATGPHTLTDLRSKFAKSGPRAMRPMPRFAVIQGDGHKVRGIDDGSYAETNLTFQAIEVVNLMPWNFSAAVAHRIYQLYNEQGRTCPRIGAFQRDETNAYRTCPAREPELHIAACCNPESGSLCFFILNGLAFGLSGSVHAYCEKSSFFAIVATDILGSVISPYVDDFTGVESLHSRGVKVVRGSSEDGIDALADILGMDFADEKKRHWNSCGTSCGVETIMNDTSLSGEVTVRASNSSRDKTIQSINYALENNFLKPQDAATLHGRLGYVLGFGKAGHGALQPIIEREHSTSTNYELNESLQASLESLLLLLRSTKPDITLFSTSRKHLSATVFTDASYQPHADFPNGRGVVAFVVFCSSGHVFYAFMVIPNEIMAFLNSIKARRTHICVLEEIALIAPYFHPLLQGIFEHCDVNHFADLPGFAQQTPNNPQREVCTRRLGQKPGSIHGIP